MSHLIEQTAKDYDMDEDDVAVIYEDSNNTGMDFYVLLEEFIKNRAMDY